MERDTETGKPTHRIVTRVRVPVGPMMKVAQRAAGRVGSKEMDIKIAAHVHKIEHLCVERLCTHEEPVVMTDQMSVEEIERAAELKVESYLDHPV